MRIRTKEQLEALRGRTETRGTLEILVPELVDLEPLGALRRAEGIILDGCRGLRSLAGLGALEQLDVLALHRMPDLVSLDGVETLREVGRVRVNACPALASLRGLAGLERVHRESRDYPFPGDVDLRDLPALGSLAGLDRLRTVQGSIQIFRTGLTSLAGLGSLEAARVCLVEMHALTSLEGAGAWRTIRLSVEDAPRLDALGGLVRAERVEHLKLRDCTALRSLHGLAGASSVGAVELFGCTITDLAGFPPVREVERLCIGRNPELTSLRGLEALERVEGEVELWGNPKLRSLEALGRLVDVGTSLYRRTSGGLRLRGDLPYGRDDFPNGGDLRIAGCDALTDLPGLEALRVVGGRLRLEELTSLADIRALSGLRVIGGGAHLTGCPALPTPPGLPTYLTADAL